MYQFVPDYLTGNKEISSTKSVILITTNSSKENTLILLE